MKYAFEPTCFNTLNGPVLQSCNFLTVPEGNHLGLIRIMTCSLLLGALPNIVECQHEFYIENYLLEFL